MKDHISGRVSACNEFREVKSIIDDFMDYYNNEDYVCELCMLSPNEYYEFLTTGIYPLSSTIFWPSGDNIKSTAL